MIWIDLNLNFLTRKKDFNPESAQEKTREMETSQIQHYRAMKEKFVKKKFDAFLLFSTFSTNTCVLCERQS